jgi:aspartate/methionine/tyrosine aminotransferase
MQALNLVFRTILRSGDNVVIPAPNFFFSGAVALAGGEVRMVSSQMRLGWEWDIDALEQACDGQTRAIVFSNPVNPTGYLPSKEMLRALLEIAEAKDLLVVSDESYSRFVYEGAFSSLGGLPGFGEYGIVIRSFSKDYALAPWRVGYIIAPIPLVLSLQAVLEWEILSVSAVSQRVAAAAALGPQDWLAGIPDAYRVRRDQVLEAVGNNPRLSCAKPPAAPFLFVDGVRLTGSPPVADAAATMLAAGIPTVPGRCFGTDDRYVRIPFGGSTKTIAVLCDRIASL